MTTMMNEEIGLPQIEIKDVDEDSQYNYTRIINLKAEDSKKRGENKDKNLLLSKYGGNGAKQFSINQ